MMSRFSKRTDAPEMMDDYSIDGEPLRRALGDLRQINRYLGGYTGTMNILAPFLKSLEPKETLRILDVGTGGADFPHFLVRWAKTQEPPLSLDIYAIDANPATVELAKQWLEESLPAAMNERIHVLEASIFELSKSFGSFDVVTCSLLLHHFKDDECAAILRIMDRISRYGFVVNDLHRHFLAYYSIKTIVRLLPVSEMVRNDGPLSVLRGFERRELAKIADSAGLAHYRLDWRWAFRWILTTLDEWQTEPILNPKERWREQQRIAIGNGETAASNREGLPT